MNLKRLSFALCVALLPALAHASVLFTSPWGGPFVEGGSIPVVTFTMTNNLGPGISITLGDPTPGPAISFDTLFLLGDPTDVITGAASTNDTTCLTSPLLSPGESCVFSIQFGTDSPLGEIDADEGIETLTVRIPYTPSNGSLTFASASATYTIFDPPPPPISEPSTFILLATALGAVGLMVHKRRSPQPRS